MLRAFPHRRDFVELSIPVGVIPRLQINDKVIYPNEVVLRQRLADDMTLGEFEECLRVKETRILESVLLHSEAAKNRGTVYIMFRNRNWMPHLTEQRSFALCLAVVWAGFDGAWALESVDTDKARPIKLR